MIKYVILLHKQPFVYLMAVFFKKSSVQSLQRYGRRFVPDDFVLDDFAFAELTESIVVTISGKR